MMVVAMVVGMDTKTIMIHTVVQKMGQAHARRPNSRGL